MVEPVGSLPEGGEAEGVAVDVFGEVNPLLFGFDFDCLVWALEKTADSIVFFIEISNIL